jgi:hypothetical protein
MNEQQELEFKIGEGEEPVDIDMGEDGQSPKIQEGEQDPHVETSGGNAEKPENELNQYSENVKKRIDKLTARLRETQRREEAAITYARNVQAEAQQMQQRMFRTDEERLHEAKGRIDTQVVALKQIIRKAREEGDIDTETEAKQRLADLTYEQRQVAEENQRREVVCAPAVAASTVNNSTRPQAQQRLPQQYQQPAPVDPKLEDWMEKNPWYGQDTVMTNTAWGIHKQLVINEGFDGSSDEYYDELDKRMRGTYPRKFSPQAQNNSTTRNVQSVAPATRSSGVNSSARRTVRLSPSQVAMAKKLGVPLEEYAKYVKE